MRTRTRLSRHISEAPRIAIGCGALLFATLATGLTACSGGGGSSLTGSPYDATEQLSFGAAGDPDLPLKITATDPGTRITDVVATDAAGRPVPGELTADGRAWRSTSLLAAESRYTVRVATEDDSGDPGRGTHTFRTGRSDAERLAVSLGPEAGTYGVGQPITAELSKPVSGQRERALVEGSLVVRSTPAVEGAWHWVDDRTLHYRPREYWPAGASITVHAELAGVALGDGLRGSDAGPLELATGDRIEAVADISTHHMTVYQNGEELRTVPITTGKEGFATRNGKKVILAREEYVRMNGTSIGIPAGSAESYDLDVYWAARLTWSGEYVHGAPWSVGSQGVDNVSHGCTGLSTENAEWFFNLVKPGDIVEHVNGFGEDMAPFGNGFGDWNLSWEEWLAGSALAGATDDTGDGTQRQQNDRGTDRENDGDAPDAGGADASGEQLTTPLTSRLKPRI
ncbi:Ig-like domain-containing protein [Streptomyces sp. 4N509B]|uniref:Ig-like domain-containing protein n=1 Tax=Streptomyces sp. 4N509B TaxID=3457413 RepID=UPI003FD3139E